MTSLQTEGRARRPTRPVHRVAAAALGVVLGTFVITSAPHLVHHLGEHQSLTGGCPVLHVLQSIPGMLASPSDVSFLLVSAVLLLVRAPLVPSVPSALTYQGRAPPPPVFSPSR